MQKQKLRVLGDRVLVSPITPKLDMPDSIIAPETVFQGYEVSGFVVSLGTEYKGALVPGATVFFSATAGQELVFHGQRFLLLPASDILAVGTDDVDTGE